MKSTNRVRKNRSASTSKSQAKIPSVPKYVLSLIEWDESKTMVCGEINMSGREFEILKNKSKHFDDPAFEKSLRQGLDVMMEDFPIFELENAAYQSNALLALLAQGLDSSRDEDGRNFLPNGSPAGGEFICGLQHLVWSTQARLKKATHSTHEVAA